MNELCKSDCLPQFSHKTYILYIKLEVLVFLFELNPKGSNADWVHFIFILSLLKWFEVVKFKLVIYESHKSNGLSENWDTYNVILIWYDASILFLFSNAANCEASILSLWNINLVYNNN